jgi:molecular chaperone Hsp33
MSELHRFLFEGLPVRGAIVRLTDGWQEILRRRESNTSSEQPGAYPAPVRALLGEMAAAAVLMQSNIKYNGAVILQITGDGPVAMAVAQAQADLSFRCTATIQGTVAADASLSDMVNVNNEGRCAITLDPQNRKPGQQTYQGVVPLFGDRREKLDDLGEVLAHYMLQSEQLDTRLILAADDHTAAGILIQRMPLEGEKNLASTEAGIGVTEDFNRIAILTASLKREELLTLPSMDILHRLYWEEKLLRHSPQEGPTGPKFACRCNTERVRRMIHSLGVAEADSIIAERGNIEVGCEFCGQQYRFDAVDAAQIFTAPIVLAPGSRSVQ